MHFVRGLFQWLLGLAIIGALVADTAESQVPTLPPQQPYLRIDPGTHTAPISQIAVDATCTLAATASEDKSVRVWRLPDGKLLHTLRPPIGPGDDGKIDAVAMAPDGSWVAAGGWDVHAKQRMESGIYVFLAATGVVLTRLGPLSDVVQYLTVSLDGRYLAATLGSGQGLRVWERKGPGAATWELVAEDNYGGADSYGIVFDKQSVLYTVTDDGKLRRYTSGFNAKPTWVATRSGRKPLSLALHPDGTRVAVGFEDTTAIDVYDAGTLVWQFAADTAGLDNGNLSSVAWSADGTRLFAGGQYTKEEHHPILVWDRAGQGLRQELRGPRDIVTDLLPCGEGMAVSAHDPAFGLLAHDNSRRVWIESVLPDHRGKLSTHFTASADARQIRFGLEAGSGAAVLFDLVAERLTDAPEPSKDLHAPDTESLPVADWDSHTPRFAGKPIELLQDEKSRSLAVAPNKLRFILGTEWRLRIYDAAGDLVRPPISIPSVAFGVNISRDGNLAVVAYGDGTIRWHRLSDGEELLALFVHAKDRRWVAWTPKGYYTASVGGEGLIGWHVNRGWNDAADWFPAYRFRKQFYRPDIVERVLSDLDEERAIVQANLLAAKSRGDENVSNQLPPTVAIEFPLEGSNPTSEEVSVDYTLRSPSGLPITRVVAQVNGSVSATDTEVTGRLGPHDKLTRRMVVKVPTEGEVTISLTAKTGEASSQPASVTLRLGRPTVRRRPTLYAVNIAVGDYRKQSLNLPAASRDALDFTHRLRKQKGRAFEDVVLYDKDGLHRDGVLLDGAATQQAIIDGVNWLKAKVSGGDLALFYFTGHGFTNVRHNSYLVPFDYDLSLKDTSTFVDKARLLNLLSEIDAKVLLFLDVCQSSDGLLAPLRAGLALGRVELPESQIMAFAASLTESRSDRSLSYFTRAVVEGLDGKIVGKNVVTPPDLDLFIVRRVQELSKGKQLPVMLMPVGDNRKYFVDLTLAIVQ